MWCIYTLSDPRTRAVRYVGQTAGRLEHDLDGRPVICPGRRAAGVPGRRHHHNGGPHACPSLCPPGFDALECAAEWEEVVPCPCVDCHGAPLPRRAADVLALAGLPTVRTQAPWVQIPTERGLLHVPAAMVAAIEGDAAVLGLDR